MNYSSKIKTKDSLYTDTGRCDSKEEYVDALITELECLSIKEVEYYDNNISSIFADCFCADMEYREDVGGLDSDSLKWYEESIRKNLMQLNSTSLAFLLNMIALNNR